MLPIILIVQYVKFFSGITGFFFDHGHVIWDTFFFHFKANHNNSYKIASFDGAKNAFVQKFKNLTSATAIKM